MYDFLNMICCNSDSDFSPGLSHRCCYSLCQAACHGAGPLGDIFIHFHLSPGNPLYFSGKSHENPVIHQAEATGTGSFNATATAKASHTVTCQQWFFAWKSDEFDAALQVFFSRFRKAHFGMSRCWMWDVFQFIEAWDSFKLRWPINLTS